MLVSKDFRKIARDSLKGRWPLAVGTGLIATLLGGNIMTGASGGSSGRDAGQDISNIASETIADPGITTLIFAVIGIISFVAIVYFLVTLIIGGAVSLGYARFNLNLVDDNNPRVEDIFSQMSRFKSGLVMQLLMTIYIFLWSLLFIIPGIIAGYSYAMTPYILYENPDMTASDAIRASKELMRGNKWRLFCLQFSFIGWIILAAFTFGIGGLFLNPYMEAAGAAFYREIKAEKMNAQYDAFKQGAYNATYKDAQ